jgi:hypothetical protein
MRPGFANVHHSIYYLPLVGIREEIRRWRECGPTTKRNFDAQLSHHHYQSTRTLCFLTLRNLLACTIEEDVVNEDQCVLLYFSAVIVQC